jgi:hypothetical protein
VANFYLGIKAWATNPNSADRALTSEIVANVTFSGISGLYSGSATWTPANTTLNVTDNLKIGIYERNGTSTFQNWLMNASTIGLTSIGLLDNQWTVYYYAYRPASSGAWLFCFGNVTTNSRTNGIKLLTWTNTPYSSLINAMADLYNRVNWNLGAQEKYFGTIFGNKSISDLETMIDDYATASDWQNVLSWSAICYKLGIERETSIKAALNGISMADWLPITTGSAYRVEYKYALWGYWWSQKYSYLTAKWNAANAFAQFNTTVYNAGHPILDALAGNASSNPYGERYYDECLSNVESYLVFYTKSGISGGLTEAAKWWDWTNNYLWYSSDPHFQYRGYDSDWKGYETAAGFSLIIESILKYYTDIGNWSRVIDDVSRRFLNTTWTSPQWMDGDANITTYTSIHYYAPSYDIYNNVTQRRIGETLGAWLGLEGVYYQLSSILKANMGTMLQGSASYLPAWELLFSPATRLWENITKQFHWFDDDLTQDNLASSYALTLFLLQGMVPSGNASIAFPLQELTYEDVFAIDKDLFALNFTSRQLTVSLSSPGNLTFQYGTVPVTYNFTQNGVYTITFSPSYNVITAVNRTGDLPSNRIYFSDIFLQLRFYGDLIESFLLNSIRPAWDFTSYKAVTETFSFSSSKSVSFSLYPSITESFAVNSLTLIAKILDFFGTIAIALGLSSSHTFSFSLFQSIIETLSVQGLFSYVGANLLNIYSVIQEIFTINESQLIQTSMTNIYGSIIIAFSAISALAGLGVWSLDAVSGIAALAFILALIAILIVVTKKD